MGPPNKPGTPAPPFLRRFQKRIYVPLPNTEARMAQFRLYTAPLTLEEDVSLEELARVSEGYSGSDIKDICQAGQLRVVRELSESGRALDSSTQPRTITLTDFKNLIRNRM